MQDSAEPKSSKSQSNAPFLMILIAAGMIGGSFGIIIADRGTFPVFKGKLTSLAGGGIGVPIASEEPETSTLNSLPSTNDKQHSSSKVIQTGISPIGAIRYTSQPNSTLLTFDLRKADLVSTGELANPDRIYIDLQDNRVERNVSERLVAEKTFKLDSDLVSRARIARKASGAMRIVLDLKRSCEFTYEAPPNATSRLMVKLRPRTVKADLAKPMRPKIIDSQVDWGASQNTSQ